MTPQSRILKTKKKLSKERIYLQCGILALLGVFILFTNFFRVVTLRRNLSLTELHIPSLMSEEISEISEPSSIIKGSSTAIVFNENAFYFGPLEAFANSLQNDDRKFYIPHPKGQIDLEALGKNLKQFLNARQMNSTPAILIPAANIDLSAIIRVVNYLRTSKIFETVILGGGLI